MAKTPTSKYSDGMVQRIQAVAAEHGALNLDLATKIAAEPDFVAAGITARGVVMKCQSLGLPYQKVERKTKDGQAVMDKADMARAVAELLGVDELDSLAKAEKADLRKLLDAVRREQLVDVPEPEAVD
jgi:hypothetical protein